MATTLLFPPSTLARMMQIEIKRAQFFQSIANEQQEKTPRWLHWLERVGLVKRFVHSKLSEKAKYQLAAESLREFQCCCTKWSIARSDHGDPEVQLLVRLFSNIELFADGQFEITKESVPLYNAALLEVAKFFVLESQRINGILRRSNVGTRVQRSDIFDVLKEQWHAFRMVKAN